MKAARVLLRLTAVLLFLVLSFQLLRVPAETRAFSGLQVTDQGYSTPVPALLPHAFINSRNDEGTTCREASQEEVKALRRRNVETLHVISSPDIQVQGLTTESTGLQIILRATSQLENYPAAKAAFINAAAHWQSIIKTPITVVIDVDFGKTWFGEKYDTNVIGQTDSQDLEDNSVYDQVRNSLISLGLNDDRSTLFNALPLSTVPTDIGTTSRIVAPSALWRAMGLINPVADPTGEKSSMGSPPAIGFNSAFDFDFDPSDGIDYDKTDFDAVATHEIGHALGFISNTGSNELSKSAPVTASVWDLFRFRPGMTIGVFPIAQRILSSGGSQDFFDGIHELALSTGRPDGSGGDKQQASHWKDDRQTGTYIGIMDPTIPDGFRAEITDNDIAALRAFGYSTAGSAASLDQAVIKGASYIDRVLRLTGTGFTRQAQVVINGQTVAPPNQVTIKKSGRKLMISAGKSSLNLHKGNNQIQVISNGISSNSFTMAL